MDEDARGKKPAPTAGGMGPVTPRGTVGFGGEGRGGPTGRGEPGGGVFWEGRGDPTTFHRKGRFRGGGLQSNPGFFYRPGGGWGGDIFLVRLGPGALPRGPERPKGGPLVPTPVPPWGSAAPMQARARGGRGAGHAR